MDISPIDTDLYERLVEGYSDAERQAFARGVLVGTKNIADKVLDLLETDLSDTEKVDAIGGQFVMIQLALAMSGIDFG